MLLLSHRLAVETLAPALLHVHLVHSLDVHPAGLPAAPAAILHRGPRQEEAAVLPRQLPGARIRGRRRVRGGGGGRRVEPAQKGRRGQHPRGPQALPDHSFAPPGASATHHARNTSAPLPGGRAGDVAEQATADARTSAEVRGHAK
jgi:hypothetical protein